MSHPDNPDFERQSGPDFTIESKSAVIVLGHSERLEVGNLWAETLDSRKIFDYIDVITLNRSAAMIGRSALRQHLKTATVMTHSAGITRVDEALQVVAINPPEPVSGVLELMRRANAVTNDPITPELGAHETGLTDLIKAGLELARSPLSTLETVSKIGSKDYSTVKRLAPCPHQFPAGMAIVHSEFDNFGFEFPRPRTPLGYLLAHSQVTTLVVPDSYHNSILFTPDKMLSAMAPRILPEV